MPLELVHGANASAATRTVCAIPTAADGLDTLRGSLRGFRSIRVDDQWRVAFRWSEGNPSDARSTSITGKGEKK
jgi:plasmid maintenance system killer protein